MIIFPLGISYPLLVSTFYTSDDTSSLNKSMLQIPKRQDTHGEEIRHEFRQVHGEFAPYGYVKDPAESSKRNFLNRGNFDLSHHRASDCLTIIINAIIDIVLEGFYYGIHYW